MKRTALMHRAAMYRRLCRFGKDAVGRRAILHAAGAIISAASLLASAHNALAAEITAAGNKSARAANAASQSDAAAIVAIGDFKTSLGDGPNGPIPPIVVDQFGYPSKARKIAIIRDPQVGYDAAVRFAPGNSYALVEAASGRVIKVGKPKAWKNGKTDPYSGDRTWWFDFSDITNPGRFVIADIDNQMRSAEFDIGDDVYGKVLKRAVKMFFYQRAGQEKAARYAGEAWADAASHVGPRQDPYSNPWPGARSSLPPSLSGARDLRGGWYDAGDYNKYTTWAAQNILVLLQAYEENPTAFGDNFDIPESGNAIPDVLDEIKWSLDWLTRMQNPDGSVLCIQSLASASPPSAAMGPSYYGPPTTAATLTSAAAFAYASKIYRGQPKLEAYALDLARRAKAAWNWAHAHPNVRYWNNDESRQPGSQGLGAGQQELSDADRALAAFRAAVHLYEITSESSFKSFAETHYAALVPKFGPTMWDIDTQDALLRFSKIKGLSSDIRKTLQDAFLDHVTRHALHFDAQLKTTDPYRAPIKDYTWGSNKGKTMQARLFQLVADYTTDDAVRNSADAAALSYAHYLHGVNPLGLVYLTNMASAGASNSANTAFHAWFAEGTRWSKVTASKPGPAPGFLVGGPNPSYAVDGCCSGPAAAGTFLCYSVSAEAMCKKNYSPPAGQPPAKSYLQFNDGWPANSWAVSEPSDTYQAYYIRLLARFVRS